MPADSNSKTHDEVETWTIQAEPPERIVQQAKQRLKEMEESENLDDVILDHLEKIELRI